MRSVLVAPVWPSSWMEMAGLVAVDWMGRTDNTVTNKLLYSAAWFHTFVRIFLKLQWYKRG